MALSQENAGGWHKVVDKNGKPLYENILTGERRKVIPYAEKLTLENKNLLRLEEDDLDWPGNTSFITKKKLVNVLKNHREQVNVIKRYFNNMVHILCRKFEGGINPSKLNASNLVRDAIAAGKNGGGRYSQFRFYSKASVGILAPKLQKQVQRQEIKLVSVLKKRKKHITKGIQAIISLIRDGAGIGIIDRECSLFVKNPLNYVTVKERSISTSPSTSSPISPELKNSSRSSPFSDSSPTPSSPHNDNSEYDINSPSSTDAITGSAPSSFHNIDLLESAYNLELKNLLSERSGLIGELSQELIEISIYAKLSMRSRTSQHATDQSQASKHKLLMDSVKKVAQRRNKLAESVINGDNSSITDKISNLQVKLSKLKLEVAKVQHESNVEKEAKATLMRQVLHIHSYAKENGGRRKKDSHTSLVINYLGNSELSRGTPAKPKTLHIGVQPVTQKAENSPSMSTAFSNYNKYQNNLSVRFKKYQRVRIKNRKGLGTILHQDESTGACNILLDQKGELLKNVLPTQIVIQKYEKWPIYNFGDRVRATNYNITGLKFYPGTIIHRNEKSNEIDYTTYRIKFDDGEELSNILPFYIQKIFVP